MEGVLSMYNLHQILRDTRALWQFIAFAA